MAIPAIAAAGIAAASAMHGIVGNIFTQKANRKSQEKINQQNIDFARESNEAQRKWEREQMDYENKINLDWWNMQNAYNSPEQQVARMKAAGLNPALLYGSAPSNTAADISSASGGAARNQVPQLDAPKYDDLALGSVFGSFLQSMQFDLQSRLTDAQIYKSNVEALKTLSETPADTDAARKAKDEALKHMNFKLQMEGNTEAQRYNLYQQQSQNNPRKMEDEHNLTVSQIAKNVVEKEFYGVRQKLAESQLRNADVQRQLSLLDLQLRKEGINPNDPGYYKDVKKIINSILDDATGDSTKNDKTWYWER